ncbi:MAG TPA: DUF1648 domain-containing protein [Terriglobales bacterium]|nr:DUF1648 domain-containing protein [Terriglobales bacterium]
MKSKSFQIAIALMWLALPLTALRYWTVWDQLPLRMATHFDASGHANGWMSRDASFQFAIGLAVFTLAIFSVIAYVMHRSKTAGVVSWAMLGLFYLVTGFIYYANCQVLDYNLAAHPIHLDVATVLIPGAALIFTAIYLGMQRGNVLPAGVSIGEEVHRSAFWAAFMGAIVVLQLAFVSQISNGGARISLALVSVILLAACALAWSGFHYQFTQSGLVISALGFRLRSIPASEITHYNVAAWNPLRGYGIRGVGNLRAYVWGNRGVRIETSQGVVFLGHDEPERIVHDLDQMRQFAH